MSNHRLASTSKSTPPQEPPAVKLNAALGGLLTYKLAGEDAIRSSGVPYVVVRPTALTEEAGRMPIEIDQGDVIKVCKVLRRYRCLGHATSPVAR